MTIDSKTKQNKATMASHHKKSYLQVVIKVMAFQDQAMYVRTLGSQKPEILNKSTAFNINTCIEYVPE